MMPAEPVASLASGTLVQAAQQLSAARTIEDVQNVVKRAARALTGADGTTFVLRDGDLCYYADEDAIGPLWKGRRFPMTSCISGWAMLNRKPAVIADIYADERIPIDAYRPTFVKSLAMVPIRSEEPIGAIGSYWASRHLATEPEIEAVQALANLASLAIQNISLFGQLERSIRMRDEFLLAAGHELRTPLAALVLELDSLVESARRDALPDSVRGHSERARASTARLAALIETLLQAAHLELGILRLAPVSADVCDVLRASVERHTERAKRAKSQIELVAGEPCIAQIDPDRIGHAVDNLLANAIKYGGGKPICVRLTSDARKIRIAIEDSGPGIEPGALERIFARFERSSPVWSYGGFGLGLFVARRLIEAHGGSVSVESTPGHGATFVIELRREPAGSPAST